MNRTHHPHPPHHPARRAFCIAELAAILAILSVLFTLAAVAQDRARRTARIGDDLTDLKQFAAGTSMYAADFNDLFWSFSWKKGQSLSQYPDLNNAPTDLDAGANQAVDILRRRGRPDMPKISPGWIPHVFYSHLVLQDYLDQPLADLSGVSSADKHRTNWALDPEGFDNNKFAPFQPPVPPDGNKRWPYSSSYQLVVAAFDKSAVGSRLSQAGSHAQYFVPPAADLGGHPVSAAAFPSQKVLMHDGSARHFEPRIAYATHDEARLPLLFVDGSVSLRAAEDANPGWLPNSPSSSNPTFFSYGPSSWEPPPITPPTELLLGRFRWTRGGIEGRDFGGPEVCTGQPGCE